MSLVQIALIVAGFLIEAIGLAVTARGLWRTWQANRPSEAEGEGAAEGWFDLRGAASGSTPLDHTRPLEELLDELNTSVGQAHAAATEAKVAVDLERESRERAIAQLELRTESVERGVKIFAQQLTVDGIPMAAAGLGILCGGLLVQTAANVLGAL